MTTAKNFRQRQDVQETVFQLAVQGIPANQIQKKLKEKYGRAYRRQEIQEDVRKYLFKEKKKDVEKYTPKRHIKYNYIDNKFGWRYQKQYNHLVEYKVKNKETGEIETKNIFISTNEKLTKGKIIEKAKEILRKNNNKYTLTKKALLTTVKIEGTILEQRPVGEGYWK